MAAYYTNILEADVLRKIFEVTEMKKIRLRSCREANMFKAAMLDI
jgi:hypothetical protein